MNRGQILEMLSKGTINLVEANKLFEDLESNEIQVKISLDTRGLTFYGMRRMPVFLYHSEFRKLCSPAVQKLVAALMEKYGEYIPSGRNEVKKEVPANLVGDSKDHPERPFRRKLEVEAK